MTQPDHGDGDPLPELSSDLWEPLSDDIFSRMLSDAMDPLAEPVDLSDVPDQAEDYPEDYVFDGDADPADVGDDDDDGDPGFGIDGLDGADDDDFDDDDLDDLDDLDTGADDGTGTGAPDADDVDDIDGGDVL